MPSARIVALAALAASSFSCRTNTSAVDPSLAGRVPAAATILAGVNMERLRASPLHQQLPPAARAFLESMGAARSLLAASDGNNYLILTRGDFREAPAGSALLTSGVAAAGSPDWVRAAGSPHHASALFARAAPVTSSDIWLAAEGRANLPVSGNGENLNRLLHATEYTTLSVRLTDRAAIAVTGVCGAPGVAQHLEETTRAWITMGAAAARRQPALANLLRKIRVTRDDRTVRIDVVVEAQEMETIARLLVGSQ